MLVGGVAMLLAQRLETCLWNLSLRSAPRHDQVHAKLEIIKVDKDILCSRNADIARAISDDNRIPTCVRRGGVGMRWE